MEGGYKLDENPDKCKMLLAKRQKQFSLLYYDIENNFNRLEKREKLTF